MRHVPTASVPTTSQHGVLAWGAGDYTLRRLPAPPELADLVERFWLVQWDLPAGYRTTVTLLPHPCVNLWTQDSPLMISGVFHSRSTHELVGRGQVFGVKFRPGGFYPFLRAPVSALTEQVRPLASLWGADPSDAFLADLAGLTDIDELAAVAARHLRKHWPAADPRVALVGRIVRALLHDRSVTRVDGVAERFGMSARSLQRLFERYVGVSPKWVLKRYRLHEAAARILEGAEGGWAAVAADLGYFDQSHFIRDFTAAVGMTPAAYAESCRSQQAPIAA